MQAILKWQCGECGELHSDKDDAIECCSPFISERYVCAKCDSVFIDGQEADDCCAENLDKADSNAIIATASMREREQHGQSRLFCD